MDWSLVGYIHNCTTIIHERERTIYKEGAIIERKGVPVRQ